MFLLQTSRTTRVTFDATGAGTRCILNRRGCHASLLQRALEAELGVSLEDYFQAWVFGSGEPSYPLANATFERTPEGAWRVSLPRHAG
jgi:hypothetical protein